ncbi:hypothetical protein [Marinibactrum halimedae]|uniref:Uncharacterized protein n=1 Tax=Marinibactrum halimedae TaxID=1444977 RepID=A0AA37T6L6_9GAMM|nr:hypothetical protein [Marinibactrum halimedae]MCD9458901.1 hypothetical protein [Marinibactrum halimedae]GLS27749.1 hypothetical protein GCM10007877_34680 [Marinibactrum halimedae]
MDDFDRLATRLEARLVRIEDSLNMLVRIEERQANSDDAIKRSFERLDKLELRVQAVEVAHSKTDSQSLFNSKVAWTVLGAFLTIATTVIAFQLR